MQHGLGPFLRQQGAAMFVYFTRPRGAKPCALKPKVKATNAGEQTANCVRAHPRFSFTFSGAIRALAIAAANSCSSSRSSALGTSPVQLSRARLDG